MAVVPVPLAVHPVPVGYVPVVAVGYVGAGVVLGLIIGVQVVGAFRGDQARHIVRQGVELDHEIVHRVEYGNSLVPRKWSAHDPAAHRLRAARIVDCVLGGGAGVGHLQKVGEVA